MGVHKLVGISGNLSRPSKSFALVQAVAGTVSRQFEVDTQVYDLTDFGDALGKARCASDLDGNGKHVIAQIIEADVLIVGTPIYKGSYTGLFKHLVDLLDPHSLQGKPVILTATGGGQRHALAVEHQLRPLFSFFAAHTLPTAIYAFDRDFDQYRLVSQPIWRRVERAVNEVSSFLPRAAPLFMAAE